MGVLKSVAHVDGENTFGHWHPASRPDTETIVQSDAEQLQTERDAPVTAGDLRETAHGIEDFGLEYAPHAAQARIVPKTEREEAIQHPPMEVAVEQEQQTVDDGDTSRVASWAPQPANTVTFDPPDLSSDEDEERLDPAWGIKRTESTQILQTINRSTSFPSYEAPRERTDEMQEMPLPYSQAEDVLHRMESDIVPEPGLEETDRLVQSANDADDDWARSANDFVENRQAQAMEPKSATDTEVRFEEGMPLISAKSKEAQIQDTMSTQLSEPAKTDPFATTADEDSFFNNIGTQPRSPLDRKTTADVLDHLGSRSSDPSDSPTRQISRAPTTDETAANAEFAQALGIVVGKDKKLEESPGDPWAAALDDDEFLVDDDDDLLPNSEPGPPSSFSNLLKGDAEEPDEFLAHLHEEPSIQRTQPSAGRGQRPDFARAPSSNSYTPHQPSTSDLAQLSPTTYGNIGFNRPMLAPMTSFQQQLQQRPAPPQKAESFVDQKGGYKSPYDLPMEIVKPRKRPQVQQPVQPNTGMLPPPPRTSSMSSNHSLQSPFSPTFPTGTGMAPFAQSSRPTPRSATVASPPKASSATKSSFFEELPITARPRPATGQGRYTPQQNPAIPAAQLLPQSPPSMQVQPSPPQPLADPYAQYQLRAPEKLDPYANIPLQAPSVPVNPATNTRYSPNPTVAIGAIRPSPSPRYSPAPPPQTALGRYAAQPGSAAAAPAAPARQYTPVLHSNTQPNSTALPFQPRTSSPLAYMGRSVLDKTEYIPHLQQTPSQYDSNTLPTRHPPVHAQEDATSTPPAEMHSPRRSQTQSPGKRGVPPSLQALVNGDFQRPASVPGPISPTRGPPAEIAPPARPSVRQRGMTGNFNFIQPTDGQEHDVLQRWKGAPIFNFGFGGFVLSSFPKHIPRYAMNSTAPMIKPSAGEVYVRNATDVIPVQDHIASFPGPLRSKSKKKDVLAWLKVRIIALEQEHLYHGNQTESPNAHKRHDEKVLLWKIVLAVVEHDGVLDGSPAFQKSVSAILSPEAHSLDDGLATQYGAGSDNSSIYRPADSSTRTETVDPDAVESLRKHLLRGEREKAVWTAVDKRLWSHALLVASTLEPTVWKQVVQEFVRQEVKSVGNNTESLAALYEVFAGNFDESIDELVPPSARAGLQMMSKDDSSGPAKNALDGLDRWRETLSLVLSNRTNNDSQALAALGKLLMSYGRIEAAHVCHIFARSPTQPLFGGVDDPYAGVVLLGADHQKYPAEFYRDEDALLLTEVYEFAFTVLANNIAASLPYLQVYKLHRASWMADTGRKAEAQAYCEALTPSFKASTKISPYYNGLFFAELDGLADRLKQVPIKSSSSWKTTPSLEKVSNSLFSKLSNFVAGDDSDADSKGSGKDVNHEFGPFANVSGTPSLSRTGSSSDLYGGYPSSIPTATTAVGSRYAPNGANTARSSSELTRGRPSLDLQRSPPPTRHSPIPPLNPYNQSSFGPPSHLNSQANIYQPMSQSSPVNQYQVTPPQTSYIPHAIQESPRPSYIPQQQDSYIPTPSLEPIQPSYMPTPPMEPELQQSFSQQPSLGGYVPHEQQAIPEMPQIEPTNGYEGPAQSYGGYEPPSGYVPYEPEPDSPDQKLIAPRKKSYMNDEDDFPGVPKTYAPQPAAPTPTISLDDAAARKRANDAAADAAFLAAAEADALKSKSQTLKPKASGWFNVGVPSVPFFGGGKKDANSLDAKAAAAKSSEPKVHRVHLGESKMSIYYDDKLKKWVNPSDPDSGKPKATLPPPPPGRGATPTGMGGPPRGLTPSATMPNLSSFGNGSGPGLGSGPPSRVGTPADNISGSRTPPPPAGAVASLNIASGPPSRPATGQSGGGDLDDLLGPGMGLGGGRRTVKGKKGGKGRYIDVMAK